MLEIASRTRPLRRSGLAEYVYETVKDSILDGLFKPSESIPVDTLSNELGVSRQPVMDALKRLSLEGFVVILPQVGCHVREYSAREITDFFRLFAEGEALIASLIAERATNNEIAVLEEISAKIGKLQDLKEDPEVISRKYRLLNRKLHYEMRSVSQSAPLAEVVETLGDRSDFFIATAHRPLFADRLARAHSEHEEIIAAFKARDAEQASAVMKTHILHVEERIRGVFNASRVVSD